MTTKKRTADAFIFGVTFLAFAGMPASAFASVEITEVMYDVPGTDSGREWLEVTNMGADAVDLSGYKLFENDTNHALTPTSGDGTLEAGASAIIAEDPAKFTTDNPSYSGTMYKASFSLSNTGETLALKNEAGDVADSITYDSSMGAAGDGNSLHRVGNSFEAGAPDPGVYTGSSPAPVVPESADANVAASQSGAQLLNGSASDALNVRMTADDQVTAGAGSFFSGSVSEGNAVRYLWNFGDGSTAEGQTVSHTYNYPGSYAVVLTAASGTATGMVRASVVANPAQLGLLVEPDGSVVLTNESTRELSIGLWSIASGTSTFVIPQNTFILGSQSVRFTTGVMGMVAGYDALLRYPNGQPATMKNVLPVSPSVAAPVSQAPAPVKVVYVPLSAAQKSKQVSAAPVPTSTPVVAGVEKTDLAASAASSSVPLTLWEGALGLVALILLGISGVWYAQAFAGPAHGTSPSSEEFSIDE